MPHVFENESAVAIAAEEVDEPRATTKDPIDLSFEIKFQEAPLMFSSRPRSFGDAIFRYPLDYASAATRNALAFRISPRADDSRSTFGSVLLIRVRLVRRSIEMLSVRIAYLGPIFAAIDLW